MFPVLGLLHRYILFPGVRQWLLFASVSLLRKFASYTNILWCVSRLSPLVNLALTETPP